MTIPILPPSEVSEVSEVSETFLREFLETYPLYRKWSVALPEALHLLPRPAINMFCKICRSNETFNMIYHYHEGTYGKDHFTRNTIHLAIARIQYVCSSCREFSRVFLLKFDAAEKYIMKVGQEPAWEISPDRNMAEILGSHVVFYRKGLICESQSYGIGAFAYYRRIIEETIDRLLEEITDLVNVEGQKEYITALEEVKRTHITEDKIKLVKDLLPSILKPDGINPLNVLHSALSEGLHSKSDEECNELAVSIREALVFLVNQVFEHKLAAQKFTASMRKLLDRKGR